MVVLGLIWINFLGMNTGWADTLPGLVATLAKGICDWPCSDCQILPLSSLTGQAGCKDHFRLKSCFKLGTGNQDFLLKA